MKRKYFILLLFMFSSILLEAQLYKPFTSFQVIKTDYFDIIFPSESETTARLLASYADRVYEQMSSLFGIKIPGRVPVTFAPHTDMFNGYYSFSPYPSIVLFDTPMDLEWTNFSNSLEGLFLHELTHAVSLNTRGPFLRVVRNIFGNWVTPAAINAPVFMVEGVTVAMESASGFGRANDPLTRQKVRQAIHEGKFLTPFQVSGVYDSPNQSGIFYQYGGLFSFWLIQTYGMEKYTELWQAMGKKFHVSFFVYRSGYYRIFKDVYGIDFLDAWDAFGASLALSGLDENTDELFPVQFRFFSESRSSVSALAAGKKDIYILDSHVDKIIVYDTQTERIRDFNANSFFSYDIDVSSDNTTLLVSGYHLTDERYRAVVTEQRADSGRKTGRTIRGLYKARYFREGVIGIRSQLHNNYIVYEDFNGSSEILFHGSEELIFSGPQALDDERIAFIVARNGERELMLFNYVSKELFRIENIADDNESPDVFLWRYMRGLNVSEGKLIFSHNIDDRMYKLASVDVDKMRAVFSNRDFSGGVFNPVSADNTVYYSGAFFSGDGFLRFPEPYDSITGTVISINLVKQNSADYGYVFNINNDEIALPDTVFDPVSRDGIALRFPASEQQILKPTPYIGILYLNPFKFWLPLPLLRLNIAADDLKLSLDGGGIFTLMADPTDRNFFMILAYADITCGMAMVEQFFWQSTVPGFPMTMEFSDRVISNSDNDPYRDTRVKLNGSFTRYPGRWGYGLSLGVSYVRNAVDNGSSSAYEWEEIASAFFLNAGITFSNLQRSKYEIFGNGLSLSLTGSSFVWHSNIKEFKPRVEGIFRASAETRFPLNLTLYGAYDSIGMNLHGASGTYGKPAFDSFASKEYLQPDGLGLIWLAGGEASVGIFSIEIQNNLSHAYFNRFFAYLTLRNVLFDSQGLTNAEGIEFHDIRLAQSLVLNFKLVSAFLPTKSAPIFIEPHIWGAWKFSNTIIGLGYPFGWGVGFEYWY